MIKKSSFVADETIEIYDLAGNLVKKHTIQNQEVNIDVKELKSGMYFIKMRSNGKEVNFKFIKL